MKQTLDKNGKNKLASNEIVVNCVGHGKKTTLKKSLKQRINRNKQPLQLGNKNLRINEKRFKSSAP